MLARRSVVLASLVVAGLALAACGGGEEPLVRSDDGCGYFKVAENELDIFTEPVVSPASLLVTLNKNDVVCVDREQQVGDRVWASIAFKLEKQNQRKLTKGWGSRRSLRAASSAELANLGVVPSEKAASPAPGRAAPTSEPAAPAPSVAAPAPQAAPPAPAAPAPQSASPAPQPAAPPPQPVAPAPQVAAPAPAPAPLPAIVRFSEPVDGRSLEQFIAGIPAFAPVEGMDESVWKKTCDNCHKWDRETLCTQARVYAKDPVAARRKQHPDGGAEKITLVKWAESGCQ